MPLVMTRLTMTLIIPLMACGPLTQSGSEPEPNSGSETVQLTIGHRSEWRELWLEGETNLPNGAYVNYRVTHDLARTAQVKDWPAKNLMEVGRSAVLDGTYWARINTLRWPAGQVTVLVQFPLPPQSPEIVQRYGEFGEHMAGEHVTMRHGIKALEVTHTFDHRP